MIVIIRKGKLKRWWDHGSVDEQIQNLTTLNRTVQAHAAKMQVVSGEALNIDPVLIAQNRSLHLALKSAQNSLEIANKQFRKKAEERVNEQRG